MITYLFFPEGTHSPVFYGRIFKSSRGSSFASLIASQQEYQHECLCPSDGSYIYYDAAIINHSDELACRIDGIVRTGGDLCNLHTDIECDGNGPNECNVTSETGLHGGSRIAFEGEEIILGKEGQTLVFSLFPEIFPGSKQLPEDIQQNFILLRGDLEMYDINWFPIGSTDEGGTLASSISELLHREHNLCHFATISITDTQDSFGTAQSNATCVSILASDSLSCNPGCSQIDYRLHRPNKESNTLGVHPSAESSGHEVEVSPDYSSMVPSPSCVLMDDNVYDMEQFFQSYACTEVGEPSEWHSVFRDID